MLHPLHVIIKRHHFGPLYDDVTISGTRCDVEGVPSPTIEIGGSFFERSFEDAAR